MAKVFKSDAAHARMVESHRKFRATLPPSVESRTVKTSIGDAHLLVGGPVDAPPLVLLHGAMASSAHVLGELTALLEKHRVHAVDVAGQSPMGALVRPSVSDDSYGKWLGEVVDGLGLAKVDVMGVSWGGFVAQRFAKVAPDRVTRLVLLVPAGMVNGDAWAGVAKLAWPMLMYRLFPNEKRLKRFVANLLTNDDPAWREHLGAAFLSYEMDMRVPTLSVPGEFAALKAPVFVVAAEGDVSFPGARLLDRAKVLFPTLTATKLLEGANHSPPTTPEFRRDFGAILNGWLATPVG